MKKALLIYTDCYVFSGSENVILNILGSKEINDEYEIRFLYRHSAQYTQKMSRVLEQHNIKAVPEPVHLKRLSDLFYNSTMPKAFKSLCFHADILFDFFLLYHLIWVPFFIIKLKKIRPDIIHINNGGYPGASSCLSLAYAARVRGIGSALMHVNNLAFPRKKAAIFAGLIDKYIGKAVCFFITGSKAAASSLSVTRGIDSASIQSVNNTVFRDELPVGEAGIVKKKQGEIWIGFVGLLTHRKGVHVLVEAMSILKPLLNEAIRVVIVGDGEEQQALKKMVGERQLDDTFLFTGYTTEVGAYLQQFDLFVLPSLGNEDFPYVLLEAMIAGKAIVSTKVAGIPEIVLDGVTGYTVNPGVPSELAGKIELMLKDREMLEKMGRDGQMRYKEMFSYNKTMGKLLDIYRTTGTANTPNLKS